MAGNKLSDKSDTEEEEEEYSNIFSQSIDLVTAGRRQVSFLQRVFESQWFHHPPTLIQSIRRYDELWMPLISDLPVNSITPPMILPPLDIQWIWFCHTLNPVTYRAYCQSRFSRLIEKSLILNDENEEYASNRCRDIWSCKYPYEPFDVIETTTTTSDEESISVDKSILEEVMKQRSLYTKFSKPYMIELVYLIAARKRYARFLYLLHKFKEECSRLVPTLDIHLVWLTHQSYPMVYARDTKNIEEDLSKVNGIWDKVNDEDMKMTRKLWEGLFDQPYEKAGGMLDEIVKSIKIPVYWEAWNSDVNSKYKSLEPRFLLEVYVSMRADREIKERQETCVRLRTVRCHRELKISKPTVSVQSDSWDKMWHLCCEFGTRGIMLELGQQSGGGAKTSCCKKNSSSKTTVVFLWYDLLRAPSLTLEKELQQKWMRAVASISPPAQAPYLLKCVPDCVTDDSGAMISDVILKMNLYRPQDGRWLSRTVLDHAGSECFVLRIRMGSGFWRRGGPFPVAVKKEERIIEVHEGSWRYVAGSIGRTPDKIVGSAVPKVDDEGSASRLENNKKTYSWSLSNGYELNVQWDSSSSGLTFNLNSPSSSQDSSVIRLLKGRKMQYQVVDNDHEQVVSDKSGGNKQDEDEEVFVTMVRYTEENPNGKATALMNWKLLVVEVTPEEDAVVVLLLCMAILRSVTEMKKEDVGGLLIRRRLKQTQLGLRDWGSVLLPVPNHSSSKSNSGGYFSSSSPHLKPWHWNPKVVMASSIESDYHHKTVRQPSGYHYTEAEGDDKLYKKGLLIIP